MKGYSITTLNEFIIKRQTDFPYAKGELSRLLSHFGIAAKIVNKKINKAGLVDILGASGNINVQGEDQKSLMYLQMKHLSQHFRPAVKFAAS
jgi:fructose-1,6-bisphosphatase I